MFSLTDNIRNLKPDGRCYLEGRQAFKAGASICDAPPYGTCWDQANWLAGWMDELADRVRAPVDKSNSGDGR